MNYPYTDINTAVREDVSNVAHAEALLSSLEAWDRAPEHHTDKTPERFVKMLHQMTDRTKEEFTFTTFPNEDVDEMITLAPIPFYTFCAHHVVPFFGNAFISYIPDERMAGLSKFARAVRYQAKGFWVQEELTNEIANFLEYNLSPMGVGVILQAEHMCMAMRGVQQPGVVTTTSAMRGVYLDTSRGARQEFMSIIAGELHGKR
jgi:GTP cyclohydrolase I